MPKSLIEQLPEIVREGRKKAERILESIENRNRVSLQTREVVLPAKDTAPLDRVISRRDDWRGGGAKIIGNSYR